MNFTELEWLLRIREDLQTKVEVVHNINFREPSFQVDKHHFKIIVVNDRINY